MAELAEVRRTLGQGRRARAGLFITVDPERDTPEVLKAWHDQFRPVVPGTARHA